MPYKFAAGPVEGPHARLIIRPHSSPVHIEAGSSLPAWPNLAYEPIGVE